MALPSTGHSASCGTSPRQVRYECLMKTDGAVRLFAHFQDQRENFNPAIKTVPCSCAASPLRAAKQLCRRSTG
jgi:hypothetical protein